MTHLELEGTPWLRIESYTAPVHGVVLVATKDGKVTYGYKPGANVVMWKVWVAEKGIFQNTFVSDTKRFPVAFVPMFSLFDSPAPPKARLSLKEEVATMIVDWVSSRNQADVSPGQLASKVVALVELHHNWQEDDE